MDLHLLSYFIAVVDRGGITKAAQTLYISQPSLSQAIRTLEKRLGVTLFDRGNRRLVLTEDGRRFEGVARRILADVDRAETKMAAVRDLDAGYVDIVTYSLLTFDPMIELARRFRARHPRVVVRIVETDGPAGVHATLRRGEAEIGVTDLSVDHPGMLTVPLYHQELVLAARPGLVAELPDPVPRSRVRTLPLVVDLADRAHTAHAAGILADDAANVVVDCAHPEATWQLVTQGVGATVVPADIARREMPHIPVRRLDPPLIRRVGLVRRAGDLSPAGSAFAAVAMSLQKGA